MDHAEAKRVWLEAVERVKDVTLAPTLWRALELGHGVTLDGECFIIGFPPSDSPMSSYLTNSDHRITIERSLSHIIGQTVRFKVIEGITEADYEAFKKREQIAAETRKAAQDRKYVERAAERQWDAIAEQCSRKYARTQLRQLPHVRAQYLFEAVQIISEAIDAIHPDGKIDEVSHRALGRVIDKVATLADVPGAIVGAELIKVRRIKKNSPTA
ncbi:MAG: hypothetical protein ABFD64_02525 [Armatimonadota bacterium]